MISSSYLGDTVSGFFATVGDLCSRLASSCGTWLGAQISFVWTSYCTWVTGMLTPNTHPFIQPVVDTVIQPVSKMIAASLLLWIIRMLFGWF